ncbi:MAG: SDR family oxidoreductase [Ilumatobacteraceae bacterium]|nr:SDR family oxidoreductase [Ilumatobacteraceae bacterium]
MGMKVLVTGANGFVGRSLCPQLLSRGIAVRAAVRSDSAGVPGLECVNMGALDAHTRWLTALAGVSVVVHLAARVHVMHDSAADPLTQYRQVNVQASLNLARQAAAAGVRRLVFVSSIKVNGELTLPGQAFSEADTPNPQDSYGVSKFEAEQGLWQIAHDSGLEIVIIRPPLVYGPGVRANFAALMRAVQRGWPLPFGAVNNLRSLVGIDNLVDFMVQCGIHPAAANQTFLISDGQDLSTPQWVQGIAQAANVPARLLPVPRWILQAAGGLTGQALAVQRLCGNLQLDISKARQRLGWSPVVTVAEGLRRAAQGGPI